MTKRLLAFGLSLLFSLALLEVLARLLGLDPLLPPDLELRQFRQSGPSALQAWEADPVMGFRPRIGYRPELGYEVYSAAGTLPNSYPWQKQHGVRRLLFLGDSVTARGRIVQALEEVLEMEGHRLEFWNAGVESFATRQEVAFYRLYNRRIQPDEVILTLHINDFQVTPVAFVNAKGELSVFAPGHRVSKPSRILFHHSRLYRWLVSLTWPDAASSEDAEGEVRRALQELLAMVDEDSARLSVLIFPLLKPPAAWSPRDRQRYEGIRNWLPPAGFNSYDLLPVLEQELAAGREVRDSPGDAWHPNASFARAIARHLKDRGFLSRPQR